MGLFRGKCATFISISLSRPNHNFMALKSVDRRLQLRKINWSKGFEALKMSKGRSGNWSQISCFQLLRSGTELFRRNFLTAQLFPLLMGRGKNWKIALYTIVCFLKQIIYLKSCKKYIYGVIIEHKPLFHVYFCNIWFL